MDNDHNLDNFEALIQQVLDAETEDFFEVAKILNLNPLKDFAGADLQEVNLRGKNLQMANFKKTNFRNANLSNTDLRGANLSNANLKGANLRNANLSNVNLNNTQVTNAIFSNNLGIDESLQLDLMTRGAIFETAESEINLDAYEKSVQNLQWLEQYEGKYVAFMNGNCVGVDEDKNILLKRIAQDFPNQSLLIKEVRNEKLNPVIDIPSFDIN